MWYIIIAGFLLLGIFFTTKLCSCNSQNHSENGNITINSYDITNDTIKGMFSKKQIDKKLNRLAETPPPTKLAFGAECYKMAYTDHSVYEYICPVCGEKTIYRKEKYPDQSWFVQNLEKTINSCRNEIQNVKGINIKLDESQFCNKCSPNIQNPTLCLLVNIAGQPDTTRIYGIDKVDILLINEFLSDKLVHSDDYDFETPLLNNIARIKELLGLK
jgi:transcription initiation factor IIE alpha subunit